MAAHAGFVTEPTAAEVRATAADAARQARAVLAALADPDDELTATAAMRNRIEGATAGRLERLGAHDATCCPVLVVAGRSSAASRSFCASDRGGACAQTFRM